MNAKRKPQEKRLKRKDRSKVQTRSPCPSAHITVPKRAHHCAKAHMPTERHECQKGAERKTNRNERKGAKSRPKLAQTVSPDIRKLQYNSWPVAEGVEGMQKENMLILLRLKTHKLKMKKQKRRKAVRLQVMLQKLIQLFR